ncbi:NUDIX hydrolase [Chloropicon primus]|uniref:NUDIX hydrolase n=2 Tax=Chloropicon primus TaxID=1764295 RepID=A0A5B8MJM8_9CHLO|nr:NUDIX hydrolase [Chloropicon primus]UPQ98812.1 NUDIX hydrolase [Chloropicon primus]|eukprot:QDZ19600.1 NUDIX hydrolase [Chloropicon primus]
MNKWVRRCNTGNAEGRQAAGLLPFTVDAVVAGYCRSDFARRLERFDECFEVSASGVTLAERLRRPKERTEAVSRVLAALREEGTITGWRDELYPVTSSFYQEPFFLMERAACPFFGLKAYGVHVCAYVEHGDGSKSMWVARRSKTKATSPSKLDHLVAGGQPHGLYLLENVIKECEEEANVPKDLAETARPAGAVSYEFLVEEGDVNWGGARGLKRDVLFCYDLKLPASFTPSNNDGEVEEFMLWPVERVMATVLETDEFKQNCNLVILDFLVRHGYITPDNCPEYLSLVAGLRTAECS